MKDENKNTVFDLLRKDKALLRDILGDMTKEDLGSHYLKQLMEHEWINLRALAAMLELPKEEQDDKKERNKAVNNVKKRKKHPKEKVMNIREDLLELKDLCSKVLEYYEID
ncbi:hypothetical protein [Chondrinema litorale]|uniref:hypothetical protein n=1 Tax=Chondrinema litorale TaxID=2994555 RepID=UPI002543620D|nr:hypothetical protein [Chondrinema litorale]UZS00058.1 hypothetical protein OQ292_39655 [Chondrinema litorale]